MMDNSVYERTASTTYAKGRMESPNSQRQQQILDLIQSAIARTVDAYTR